MALSVKKLAFTAYEAILTRLHWLRMRYRKDKRVGDFWARALLRVGGKSSVKSHAHWYAAQESFAVAPVHFSSSRFALALVPPEEFTPPQITATSLVQPAEVVA